MLGYGTAVKGLGEEQRHIVRTALSLLHDHGSAIVRRFASNIEKETRLPDWVWNQVFSAISDGGTWIASQKGADQLTQGMRAALSRCLKLDPAIRAVPSAFPVGPPIDDLFVQAYGRVVTFRQLAKMWRWSSPAGSSPRKKPVMSTRQVGNFIEDLTTKTGLAARQAGSVLSGCALGRYVMWSTFDPEAFGPDPFVPRASKLRDLVATLGLDSLILFGPPSKDDVKPLPEPPTCVLLSYTLPPSYKPHVPTVVEAYAGDGRMNYYFDVFGGDVDVNKRVFPRTLPVPSHQDSKGCPEVVHSVVFGDRLTAPIELQKLD